MPAVWSRHPKYALFVLPGRLAMADRIYDKLLEDRKGLIKKFGPNPDDLGMFPPNKDPWPANTVWDFFPAVYNCPQNIKRLGCSW
ncbi:hypothetical protein MPER_06273 [Moniliophthora perniciosa FA553]|nr:hypothetical protein MPER_06273 [Moniliophthora perniciosa FA553]